MSQPPFYVLSEGKDNQFSSHDTSRAGFHHQDLDAFSEDVNNAAKRAFPNHGRSRYETVNVCLIRWEDDELGVQEELSALNSVLQDYGFQTNIFLIPGMNSHWDLMRKTLDFIQAYDNDQNLFVLYYAGHGRMNSARQAEWIFGRSPNSPFVDWSAIQGLFGTAKSDVLILLDTCAAASSATTSQFAVMETIAACGFERRAPPPGEHSLTNTLIDVLRDWINKPSFSAASLHTEILFRTEAEGSQKGSRNTLPSQSTTPPAETPDEDDSSTPLSSVSSDGSYKVPHILITLQLEENQPLDARQCARWLDKFPLLAKWVKVEAVFPSYSTLMILSVPMPIWDLLPDHPSCSFIGYATGPNIRVPKELLLGNASTAEHTKSQGVGDTAHNDDESFQVPLHNRKTETVVTNEELLEQLDWKSKDVKYEQLPDKSDILSRQSYSVNDLHSSGIAKRDVNVAKEHEQSQEKLLTDKASSQRKLGEMTTHRPSYTTGSSSWTVLQKYSFWDKQPSETDQNSNSHSNYEANSTTIDLKQARANTSNATEKGDESTARVTSGSKRKGIRAKRSGCSNCNMRRLKCDETRPQCRKCVRSGRQCDRYPSQKAILDVPVPTRSGEKAIITIVSLDPVFAFDPQEDHYFGSSRVFTTTDVWEILKSPTWARTILQEFHDIGFTGHAVLALADLHETLGGQPTTHRRFTLQAYGHAFTTMREKLMSNGRSKGTVLMSIVLSVCVHCFAGDAKAAVSQVQHGLRILGESPPDHGIEDEILQTFTRLVIQIKSCDEAFHFPHPYALHLCTDGSTLLPTLLASPSDEALADLAVLQIPTKFNTTAESRRFSDLLQVRLIHFHELLSSFHTRPNCIFPAAVQSSALTFGAQLSAWSSAHKHIFGFRRKFGVSSQEWAERSVLKMNNNTTTVLFPANFSTKEKMFDKFYLYFKEIVALAKDIVFAEELSFDQGMRRNFAEQKSTTNFDASVTYSGLAIPTIHDQDRRRKRYEYTGITQSSPEQDVSIHARPSFTSGLGIVYPLYVVATKCRDRKLRRDAIWLLLSYPRREGLWDSTLSAHVAQWVMAIEEEGLTAWNPSRMEDVAADLVAEDKRVTVKEVLFDLQDRTAKCKCGRRSVRDGDPDDRARETVLKW